MEEQSNNRRDRFSQFMFGTRPQQKSNEEAQPAKETEEQPNGQEIDFIQIMSQIDSIMGSINELKPMFKQITPLLNIFKK